MSILTRKHPRPRFVSRPSVQELEGRALLATFNPLPAAASLAVVGQPYVVDGHMGGLAPSGTVSTSFDDTSHFNPTAYSPQTGTYTIFHVWDTPGTKQVYVRASDASGDFNFSLTVNVLAAAPTYDFQTLSSFNPTSGAAPKAPLLSLSTALFGTTPYGGAHGLGTTYDVSLDVRPPGGYPINPVASFSVDTGGMPSDGLVSYQGNVYGMTQYGGAGGLGTVYETTFGPDATITPIATFHGPDGVFPKGGLTVDGDGNLYGTTVGGGAYGYGTIFKIDAQTHALTTLASFNYTSATDGYAPQGGVAIDPFGNIWGTTSAGGTHGAGTVFEYIPTANLLTTIDSFDLATTGYLPGRLIVSPGIDYSLYGVAQAGGPGSAGTVFQVSVGHRPIPGTIRISRLAAFDGPNGATPSDALTLDSSGNLYGTTVYGGADNAGTAFEIAANDPSHSITTLATFDGSAGGANPYGGLTFAFSPSGNLYGTTSAGGTYGLGTLFELGLHQRTPTSSDLVHIMYLVPSDRTASPVAIANLKADVLEGQAFFRDQMARYGFGPKTFQFEAASDGTPVVHIVTAPNTADYYRVDPWGRVAQAGINAGLPIWQPGNVWLECYDGLVENPDGSTAGGFYGAFGYGSGDGAGVALVANDAVAIGPGDLTNNTAYAGTTLSDFGPYPMVQGATFPWYEGTTYSEIASAHLCGVIHEITHALTNTGHDFINDANFNGDLMGNGLRGIRGWVYPDLYTTDDTRLDYNEALDFNSSRYFNVGQTFSTDTPPTVSTPTVRVAPDGREVEVTFDATDGVGFAAVQLWEDGNLVAGYPLTGTSVHGWSFSTPYFTPGVTSQYEVKVYDTQGNFIISPAVAFTAPSDGNYAPMPSVLADHSTVYAGQTVTFDATQSLDRAPVSGTTPDLQVTWDLGNGQFVASPTGETITTQFMTPGIYYVRARITDLDIGYTEDSNLIAVRVLPAPVVNSITLKVFDASGRDVSGGVVNPG